MTVKELIEELKKMPEDAEMLVLDSNGTIELGRVYQSAGSVYIE